MQPIFKKYEKEIESSKDKNKGKQKENVDNKQNIKHPVPEIFPQMQNKLKNQLQTNIIPVPNMSKAPYKISEFKYANTNHKEITRSSEEKLKQTKIDFSNPMFNITGMNIQTGNRK